jgi:hypothetical protein
MQTENNHREIPPIPGGGSWTFDYDQWEWISNDPAPVVNAEPVHIEFKAEE